MFEKLKQFKDLRDQAKQLKNQLAHESVFIDKDGIQLVMDGNQEALRIEVDPNLLTAENKEKLETLLCQAFNEATKKVQQLMVEKIRTSGNFNLPGLS